MNAPSRRLDPAVEARAHMACGGYHRAIQILEQALHAQPSRADLQQLLEQARGNTGHPAPAAAHQAREDLAEDLTPAQSPSQGWIGGAGDLYKGCNVYAFSRDENSPKNMLLGGIGCGALIVIVGLFAGVGIHSVGLYVSAGFFVAFGVLLWGAKSVFIKLFGERLLVVDEMNKCLTLEQEGWLYKYELDIPFANIRRLEIEQYDENEDNDETYTSKYIYHLHVHAAEQGKITLFKGWNLREDLESNAREIARSIEKFFPHKKNVFRG